MDLDLSNDILEDTLSPEEKVERQWGILIDQIFKGNVIPVIGSGLTRCDGMSIDDILVKSISKQCNMKTPAHSFSQLIPRFKTEHKDDDIYDFVGRVLANEKYSSLTSPSKDLVSLLSIKYFPFVIYTSYDQTVEKAMKQVHSNKLRVYYFDNNANPNADIPPMDNLKTPTLYYMFGRANTEGRRYVLSDKDMLDFSRTWLAKTDSGNKDKPANLSNTLANKFLLVLGCDYSDWLLRFLWFAMKDTEIKTKEDNKKKIGMLTIDGYSNEELMDFFTRSNTLTQNLPISEFIKELCARIKREETERNSINVQEKFDSPQDNTDVFISYSRADKEITERLYNALTKEGLDVWYDKKNLGIGTKFWEDIRDAIRTTKLFVPILTNSIKKQAREEHVYRDEWREAVARERRIGNITYICSLCFDDFDINDKVSKIPDEFKEHNAHIIPHTFTDDELHSFVIGIKSELLKLKQDEQ